MSSYQEPPVTHEPLDLQGLVQALRQDPALAAQILHVEELPPRKAALGEWPSTLHPEARKRLEGVGRGTPYLHQARATEHALHGEDVVVVTGTNSGKTLCYNVPVLHSLLSEPVARALYLFPTKALAQDQLGKLEELMPKDFRVGAYDGDTPTSRRGPLRKVGQVILTNPDMLHVGILPGHELWVSFLKSLRFIVIDEMHVYRGVFGSHVGGILRRLLRLCAWHRSRPQIIACSATIGNPLEVFTKLTGRKATLVDEDGSPQARRTFVFWNPPILEEEKRASTNMVSSEVLATLVEFGHRTLCFNRARVSTELVLRYTRRRLEAGGKVPAEAVESYRGGYTVKERRQIETGLFKGKLLGLAATNAMELGVDVGGLDAVVMNGYPGSLSAFWQQAGRAGRGVRDGLAVMVAHDDPLEQFLIRNPERIVEGQPESVAVNPENAHILSAQLRCAAHERPISPTELMEFGPTALPLAEGMDRSGELAFQAGMFFYPTHAAPASGVNIRGTGGTAVRLLVDGEELGTMDHWRALQQAHAGAVYLHRGNGYLVRDLDLNANVAHVEAATVPYYTRPIIQSVLETRVLLDEKPCGIATAVFCGVTVTDAVVGYRKVALDLDRVLDTESLDLPAETFETVGVRFDFPAQEDLEGFLPGLHAVEHALLALAPLMAGCDRSDLGSAWYGLYADTLRPAIFIFDRAPGGVGLAERLFVSLTGWLRGALQLLAGCGCADGCPSCLYSASCEAGNEVLSKRAGLALLRSVVDG